MRGRGGRTDKGEWVERAGRGVGVERETGEEWRKEEWVEEEERSEEGEIERGGVEEEREGEEWKGGRGGTAGVWVIGVELPWFKVPRGGGSRRLAMVWLVSLIDILLMILLDLRLPCEGVGPGGELETLAGSR